MTRSHWWFLMVAGVTLLLLPIAGGAWLLSNQLPTVIEGWRSRSWPSVTARIEHSVAIQKYQASRNRRNGQGTHVTELRYAFEVDRRPYTGGRRSLDAEGKINPKQSAERLVKQVPVGSAVTAYFDPTDPSRSLLEPGVPIGGVLASMLAVGLVGGALYVLRTMVRGLWNSRPRRRVRYA